MLFSKMGYLAPWRAMYVYVLIILGPEMTFVNIRPKNQMHPSFVSPRVWKNMEEHKKR
jgi:hypothetical protein